jgi:hypothetical protein
MSLHPRNGSRLKYERKKEFSVMRRLPWTMASVFVFVALLLAFAPAGVRAAQTYPDEIALPNGWLPEGIVTGHGPVIYSGSRANGAIYAANLRTGEGEIVVPGQTGRISVGLSFDSRTNYIFAAGGGTGKAYVYDVDTGDLVREYTLTAPPTFVNDVIVTREAAYFTDSAKAVYYRVPLGPGGQLADQSAVETIALTGDFQQGPSNSSNGIEATPNGKELIIVNSSLGLLYRVDPLSGEATVIDLGGASVTMGDGLLLHGRTLYVVRNRINQIVVVKLAPDLSSGTVLGTLTQPNFDVPTTIAEFGNALYVVNARFTTPATPDTTYNIVRVTAEL